LTEQKQGPSLKSALGGMGFSCVGADPLIVLRTAFVFGFAALPAGVVAQETRGLTEQLGGLINPWRRVRHGYRHKPPPGRQDRKTGQGKDRENGHNIYNHRSDGYLSTAAA
jgi:hypothetical protein